MCSLIAHTSPSAYSHAGYETSICNFEVTGFAYYLDIFLLHTIIIKRITTSPL